MKDIDITWKKSSLLYSILSCTPIFQEVYMKTKKIRFVCTSNKEWKIDLKSLNGRWLKLNLNCSQFPKLSYLLCHPLHVQHFLKVYFNTSFGTFFEPHYQNVCVHIVFCILQSRPLPLSLTLRSYCIMQDIKYMGVSSMFLNILECICVCYGQTDDMILKLPKFILKIYWNVSADWRSLPKGKILPFS